MYPSYVTDPDALDLAFQDIIKALNDDSAGFLFGAGMSAASGVPTGNQLLQSLLRLRFPDTGVDPPDDDILRRLVQEFPFEVSVEAIANRLGRYREQLTEELKRILLEPNFKPSTAHEDFAAVCFWGGRPRLDRVFTTNFDLLLEAVLGESRAVPITESNAKEISKVVGKSKIPILHLHGVLDGIYQITETELYNDDYKALNSEFRTALGYKNAFVLVGYSMNDPDFRNIYLSYRREIIARRVGDKKTYVVSPARDGYSYRLGSDVWKVRGADWIPLDAATFFARLKYLLEHRFDKETRDSVKSKFNLGDEKALEDLIARVADALRVDPADALEFLKESRTKGGGQ
ncbi:MAG TPA: SIR2 family protein [Pyrinomonadaceae bacterium]|nr:SIR2 family protein [Pyrinomonadaceae bacterium]